jgi:hypothetical protein
MANDRPVTLADDRAVTFLDNGPVAFFSFLALAPQRIEAAILAPLLTGALSLVAIVLLLSRLIGRPLLNGWSLRVLIRRLLLRMVLLIQSLLRLLRLRLLLNDWRLRLRALRLNDLRFWRLLDGRRRGCCGFDCC